jgi:hypothetical protein
VVLDVVFVLTAWLCFAVALAAVAGCARLMG